MAGTTGRVAVRRAAARNASGNGRAPDESALTPKQSDRRRRVIQAAISLATKGGYDAVQIAYDAVPERKVTKPALGHLKKHDVDGAYRRLMELRGQSALVVGENVTVEAFEPGEKVKVSGISHGKGFAGTIKRHRFHSGPKSHGSHNVRAPGSVGASATPSRVFKGTRLPGRLGGKRATQVGLVVHGVDAERNLLLVKGAVPGPKNGFVEVREESR